MYIYVHMYIYTYRYVYIVSPAIQSTSRVEDGMYIYIYIYRVSPAIQSTSRESRMVSPSPTQSVPFLLTGLSSSNPQA